VAEHDGFLSRWARRKEQVRRGEAPAETAPPPPVPVPPVAPVPPTAAAAAAPDPAAPPPPTLEDVAALTRDADFSRFVAPGVGDDVKRAAMKKLFSDPHFNIMDGLDTYIEDYNTPDPLPASWLRRMAQSKALGLFDDEEALPQASPDGAALAQASSSPTALPSAAHEPAPPDEDPDLRLQRHDGAGRPGPGPGPKGDAGGRA
jgi:hypothetical protein